MILNIGRENVVMIALVIAALLVSGCSGPGGSVTPTPTPVPQASERPTAAPTWVTSGSPTLTGQLYDMSGLNWYEFRFDSTSNFTTSAGDYRFEFDDRPYNGMATRHTRVTYRDLALGNTGLPDSIIDAYASKENNSIIGGHVKLSSAGQVTTDRDMAGGQITGMMNRGFAYTAVLDRDARLTAAGPGAIDLNGMQFACTKYNYTVDGILRTAWYTPDAPAPLKVTWTLTDEASPVYVTVTLTGWG